MLYHHRENEPDKVEFWEDDERTNQSEIEKHMGGIYEMVESTKYWDKMGF